MCVIDVLTHTYSSCVTHSLIHLHTHSQYNSVNCDYNEREAYVSDVGFLTFPP